MHADSLQKHCISFLRLLGFSACRQSSGWICVFHLPFSHTDIMGLVLKSAYRGVNPAAIALAFGTGGYGNNWAIDISYRILMSILDCLS
jgi:hypothetical protein